MATAIIVSALLALLSSSIASPIAVGDRKIIRRFSPWHNGFKLVTADSYTASFSPATLPNVSAISLFDPFDQANYLLRLIGPGYGSLPVFNITQTGLLQTVAEGPEATGEWVYTSEGAEDGQNLEFTSTSPPMKAPVEGSLGLLWGYLLTVNGSEEGWTICDGPIGQKVIKWQGEGCTATYLHAVDIAPY
ncbi:Hypothetical protein R9X50_00486500 [Acrodontium crateriforme]|uniref:Uncharacterized protein n=1 Tax=Acrodontium crateriforme TaxID=150365 RepID=A0AAQ3RAG1_9PEZI|nr:Hypothetical protein R9X50_00486500 [Acrodontium crateriforme]